MLGTIVLIFLVLFWIYWAIITYQYNNRKKHSRQRRLKIMVREKMKRTKIEKMVLEEHNEEEQIVSLEGYSQPSHCRPMKNRQFYEHQQQTINFSVLDDISQANAIKNGESMFEGSEMYSECQRITNQKLDSFERQRQRQKQMEMEMQMERQKYEEQKKNEEENQGHFLDLLANYNLKCSKKFRMSSFEEEEKKIQSEEEEIKLKLENKQESYNSSSIGNNNTQILTKDKEILKNIEEDQQQKIMERKQKKITNICSEHQKNQSYELSVSQNEIKKKISEVLLKKEFEDEKISENIQKPYAVFLKNEQPDRNYENLPFQNESRQYKNQSEEYGMGYEFIVRGSSEESDQDDKIQRKNQIKTRQLTQNKISNRNMEENEPKNKKNNGKNQQNTLALKKMTTQFQILQGMEKDRSLLYRTVEEKQQNIQRLKQQIQQLKQKLLKTIEEQNTNTKILKLELAQRLNMINKLKTQIMQIAENYQNHILKLERQHQVKYSLLEKQFQLSKSQQYQDSFKYSSRTQQLSNKIQSLENANFSLNEELQFCKEILEQANKTSNEQQQQINKLKTPKLKQPPQKHQHQHQQQKQKCKEFHHSILSVAQLRSEVSKLTPIVEEYDKLNMRYMEMRAKYSKFSNHLKEKSEKKQGKQIKQINAQSSKSSNKNILNTIQSSSKRQINQLQMSHQSQNSQQNYIASDYNPQKKTSTILHYGFLANCSFITLPNKQFIYACIHRLSRGVIRSKKLFNSKENNENLKALIQRKKGILLLLHLQNNKIIGAYSSCDIYSSNEGYVDDKSAFLMDVSSQKIFNNNMQGRHSIKIEKDKLTWGHNDLMVKLNQLNVLYSNFGQQSSVFWDRKYSLSQLLGTDKKWVAVRQLQIHQIYKLY